MEIEKERNIHYLHPDFEEENENKEKKPSPLALLAQTCQSIGFCKQDYPTTRDKSCSPNSTSTSTKRSIKRSNSDYLSNPSNSPSIADSSPPSKKTKIISEIDSNENKVELNHADTSTDLGKEFNQSLINGFMNFLKNSNNSQQNYTDKLEFLYYLTNRFMNHDLNPVPDKPRDNSYFNLFNGYHLKSPIVESIKLPEENCLLNNNNNNNNQQKCFEKLGSVIIDQTQKLSPPSTIKYCMYCGKLIPLLPMLLAHIKIDHGNDQLNDHLRMPPTQMPSFCDLLTKFNPYNNNNNNNNNNNLSNHLKSSSQSCPIPTITNYINNWSSMLGYENLIF